MKNLLMDFFKNAAIELFGSQAPERKEFLEEVLKRKLRNDLIEQEKKKNHHQLAEFNKRLRGNQKELEKIEREIERLQEKLKIVTASEKIAKPEEREFLAQISNLQMRVISVKTPVSPDVSFEGNDRIRDAYYLFEESRKHQVTVLDELNQQVMDNVYQNSLAGEYEDKFQEIQKRTSELLERCKTQFENAVSANKEQFMSEIRKWQSQLNEMMPERIQINELSEDDTKAYFTKLNDYFGQVLEVCNQQLFPYIEYMKSMRINGSNLSLLEAYKSKEIELSQKVDMFYELAQVGLSIDVVDHQFNVLYSQISTELRNLKKRQIQIL